MIIYRVTCLVNGKVYIGQTRQLLERRRQGHFYRTRHPEIKDASSFHRALLKYEKDAFLWDILEKCRSVKRMGEREAYWIKQYKATDRRLGYNETTGGETYKMSKESRKRMSKGRKGIPAWNKGVPLSDETKKKLSLANMGRTSPNKGKRFSKEHRENLRIAHLGRNFREGYKWPTETKHKMMNWISIRR